MGVWQDDFHELPTGGTGKGVQGCALSRRLCERNAKPKNGLAGRQDTGKS